MNRQSTFSYQCNQCGRCCHNQVITLSPVDVIAIARATGLTTSAIVARYTMRRGSLLRFDLDGGCAALDGLRCTIHLGRPLACRLYPLGIERDGSRERFIRLEPASGSAGVYGDTATVSDFLSGQGVDDLLLLNERYRPLIATMRDRVASVIDFDIVEPNEFWKRAVAEALRETNFDANRIIDTLFDADGVGCYRDSLAATVDAHLEVLSAMTLCESDPATLAVAAVMLPISLGYSPAEAIAGGSS
jgi:Fe-S-cluster containining protein